MMPLWRGRENADSGVFFTVPSRVAMNTKCVSSYCLMGSTAVTDEVRRGAPERLEAVDVDLAEPRRRQTLEREGGCAIRPRTGVRGER